MDQDDLKRKIHDFLRQGYFNDPDDAVDVSDGFDDNIHVVVFSRKFNGRRMKEKHEMIWSCLARLAPEEWGRVSLSVGVSPEEAKAI